MQNIATEQQKTYAFNQLKSMDSQELNKKQPQLKRKRHISKWKDLPYFINKSGIVAPVVKGGDHA